MCYPSANEFLVRQRFVEKEKSVQAGRFSSGGREGFVRIQPETY